MPRQSPHICILADGRRVPFSLKSRPGEPFYLVCFRSPHGQRLERSTKEASLKRAVDAAQAIIQQEYEPNVRPAFVEWDEAVELLRKALAENNNKLKTAKDYLSTIEVLREIYPK